MVVMRYRNWFPKEVVDMFKTQVDTSLNNLI